MVLIPVVVGSLLGLFASLSTTAYTTWATQKEKTIRGALSIWSRR